MRDATSPRLGPAILPLHYAQRLVPLLKPGLREAIDGAYLALQLGQASLPIPGGAHPDHDRFLYHSVVQVLLGIH